MATKRTTRNRTGSGSSSSPISKEDISSLPPSQLESLSSYALDRLQFGLDHGLTSYDGKRDLFRALGYKKSLTITDYINRYKRGGIARRIVRFLPTRVWSGSIQVIDNPDPNIQTEFESRVEELFKRPGLKLRRRLIQAHMLAMLGRYSCILIGGGKTPLNQELKSLPNSDGLFLNVLSESRCTIKSRDKSTTSARFGLPLVYTIQPCEGENDKPIDVHWSRIIHIVRSPLESDIYGEPMLEACWNDLDNLYKIVGSGAEKHWRNSRLLHAKLDPKYKAAPGSLKKLENSIEDLEHGLKTTLYTKGVDVESVGVSGGSFAQDADTCLDLIAGTIALPKRRLLGSERGELASQQDRFNEQDTIDAEREEFAEPELLRQLFDRFVLVGVLPNPLDNEYTVLWPEEDKLTEGEKIDVVNKIATANESMVKAGGGLIMTADEMRDGYLSLEPLDEIDQDDDDDDTETEPEPEDDELDSSLTANSSPRLNATKSNTRIRDIHRIVDSSIPSFAETMLSLFSSMSDSILDNEELEWTPESVDSSVRTIMSDVLATPIENKLISALVDGSVVGAKDVKKLVTSGGTKRVNAIEIVLDGNNSLVTQYARARAAELVQELTADTLLSIRELVALSTQEGFNRQQLSQQIARNVGLHSDQIRASRNLRAELLSSAPGKVVSRIPPRDRLRDHAGFRAKIPKGGPTQAWVDKQLARYERISLNYRARRIARTELTKSANEGQRLLWQQSQEKGYLPKDIKRVWLSNTKRHADMEGQRVGINESFNPAIEPGETVNCGCSQAIDV